MPDLDLTDPLVRAMADRDHLPGERWTLGGQLVAVGCQACAHEWPCPTRVALRAMEVDGAQ